jgi:Putative restriction endonuclease
LLPIVYRRRGEKRTRQVAPDVLVAFVLQRPRDSYDLAAEGGFPAFVLEVVSSSSVARDVDAKRRLYEALGAQEYVLFAPERGLLEPRLQGHRRGAAGRFEPWAPDAAGRLWSDILELWLVPEGSLLRAVQADGQPLLTYEESEAARRQAEAAREQEAAARQRAEEELARLRALLERGKHED